jgi:hypothetical protein
MRLVSIRVVLALVLVFALGCESPAAFPVPDGPPMAMALDVQLPYNTLGTWFLQGFSESLALELAKYNIRVVEKREAATAVAVINLGLYGYHQVIDAYLSRDGQTKPAGRVHMPDLSETTVEMAAQLVAQVVARSAWGLGEPAPDP